MAESETQPEPEPSPEAEPQLAPWVRIYPSNLTELVVRAGWLDTSDGQWRELQIDATIGIDQSGQAVTLALTWYADTVAQMAQHQSESEDED